MDEMNMYEWLAEQFESERPHLRVVAYRLLGSLPEADDAVQESWLRLSRSDTSSIENLGGWLTTVVARVCLDMLRSRKSSQEETLEADTPEPLLSHEEGANPEHAVMLTDSVGLALLVVLDTLNPAERLAFVLHDIFAVPFDEIAPIVGRSPAAARQLASRARRRVQGAPSNPDADLTHQRAVIDAFLAASREGRFDALLALLDPDVVLRADAAAVQSGAQGEILGAQAVAETFSGRARVAKPALIQGTRTIGAVWAASGKPRVVFAFTITHGKIVAIELVADPEHMRQLDPVALEA
ncbi:MAG TPA: sigma-70 family RNA polymerase sigma factor [Ktedonobacteraceae bacterium]|nr:sigma-70 family RNA polymerase sigma factor [Ktedonobacteraceae bacterium]